MEPRIRFDSVTAEPLGDRVRVGGRCMAGPIRRGDTFGTMQIGQERESVNLMVERIELYGNDIESLDPVFSGRLTLSGDGLDRIKPKTSFRD